MKIFYLVISARLEDLWDITCDCTHKLSVYGIEIETPGLRRTPRGLRRTLQLGKGRLRGLKCAKVSEGRNSDDCI